LCRHGPKNAKSAAGQLALLHNNTSGFARGGEREGEACAERNHAAVCTLHTSVALTCTRCAAPQAYTCTSHMHALHSTSGIHLQLSHACAALYLRHPACDAAPDTRAGGKAPAMESRLSTLATCEFGVRTSLEAHNQLSCPRSYSLENLEPKPVTCERPTAGKVQHTQRSHVRAAIHFKHLPCDIRGPRRAHHENSPCGFLRGTPSS